MRAGVGWAALVVVATVGCGGAVPDEGPPWSPLYRSGSRLRAKVEDAGGGAIRHVGWYDGAIEQDCYFEVASDGETRCLPVTDVVQYADAECTILAVARFGGECGGSPGKYGTAFTPDDAECGGVTTLSIYPVGEPIGRGPTYNLIRGECSLGLTDVELYSVGEEIAPSTFVGVASLTDERHGAIGARVLTAEDGAEQITELYRSDTGERCALYASRDGEEQYCLGSVVGLYADDYGAFGDPECTESAALVDPCFEPSMIVRYDPRLCAAPSAALFELGAAFESAYAKDPSTGTCQPRTDGIVAYAPGAPIDESTLPSLHPVTEGTGRLVVVGYAGSDEVVIQSGAFADAASGDLCDSPETFEDAPDLRYCLPPHLDVLPSVFVDEECESPVASWEIGECETTPPELAVLEELSGCFVVAKSIHRLAPFDGETVYVESGGCHAIARTDLFSETAMLFQIGEDVPRDYPSYRARTE